MKTESITTLSTLNFALKEQYKTDQNNLDLKILQTASMTEVGNH